MATLGIDYSFARPSAVAMAKKYKFVCRYLSSDSGKALSKAELSGLHSHGLSVVLVWEDSASAALGGKTQGIADAKAALGQANALGIIDRPIYFAVDFDATPAQQATINAYMQGVASIIGLERTGVYGGYYVTTRCLEAKVAKWFWQTCAWSGGQIQNGVHIYQNGQSDFNGGADIDEAWQEDYGQWPAPVPKSVPKPKPVVKTTPAPKPSPAPSKAPETAPPVPQKQKPAKTPPSKDIASTSLPLNKTVTHVSWWVQVWNWLLKLVGVKK